MANGGIIGTNLIGKEFERWKVLSFSHRNKKLDKYWLCECKCGTIKPVKQASLVSGNSISCGCYQKEMAAELKFTHGLSRSHEYTCWCCMKQRCYNENHVEYEYYGKNGIIVCDRWINSFENFYEDMGAAPSEKHTIHRKGMGNTNYEPKNCVWATPKEQSRAKIDNINITYNNKTQCLMDWSIELGIKYVTLRSRIMVYGWSIEKAFAEKVS